MNEELRAVSWLNRGIAQRKREDMTYEGGKEQRTEEEGPEQDGDFCCLSTTVTKVTIINQPGHPVVRVRMNVLFAFGLCHSTIHI